MDAELRSMREGVVSMCAITTDLKDMEKLRSGTFKVQEGPVIVRAAVEVCVSQVRAALGVRPARSTTCSNCCANDGRANHAGDERLACAPGSGHRTQRTDRGASAAMRHSEQSLVYACQALCFHS